MFYIGIDQSYTSTGLIVLNDSSEIVLCKIVSTDKSDDIFKRAWQISEELLDAIGKFAPCCISIEGLAFSMTGNATRDLAGLQFLIVSKIKFVSGLNISIVSPPSLKKFATSNGKAKKNDMIDALPEDVFDYFTKTLKIKKSKGLTDVTDAYFLAKHTFENNASKNICNK